MTQGSLSRSYQRVSRTAIVLYFPNLPVKSLEKIISLKGDCKPLEILFLYLLGNDELINYISIPLKGTFD